MPEKLVSSRISQDVIALFVSRGMTLTDIAASLHVTKSYISRVKAGTRSLTLDHLSTFERLTGESLPLLLLQSTPRKFIPKNAMPLYEATMNLLKGTFTKSDRTTIKAATNRRAREARGLK